MNVKLAPGDKAPDFDLPLAGGGRITLADLAGESALFGSTPRREPRCVHARRATFAITPRSSLLAVHEFSAFPRTPLKKSKSLWKRRGSLSPWLRMSATP